MSVPKGQPLDEAAQPSRLGRARRSHTSSFQEIFSHDIKNQLNVILGYVCLLREGGLDAVRVARALDLIESSAQSAIGLTMNLSHAMKSAAARDAGYSDRDPRAEMNDDQPNARL